MITEMVKDEVTEIGARNNLTYLLEQSGYTISLAKLDGKPLIELLPDTKYLDEVAEAGENVREAVKDRTLSAAESKSSTQQVNDLLREAKVWRRSVVARSKRAIKLGKKIPDVLLTSDGVQGVPGISEQMDKMVKLLESNSENLPGGNLQTMIKQGKELAESIKTINAAQELKHLKELPDKVRKFYYQKGLLFIGLKQVCVH